METAVCVINNVITIRIEWRREQELIILLIKYLLVIWKPEMINMLFAVNSKWNLVLMLWLLTVNQILIFPPIFESLLCCIWSISWAFQFLATTTLVMNINGVPIQLSLIPGGCFLVRDIGGRLVPQPSSVWRLREQALSVLYHSGSTLSRPSVYIPLLPASDYIR